jgi:hypothetical protein
MPKLKTTYEKQDEIPDGYGDLYTERGGKFELTGIEGVKTQADIDRINAALAKERTDHKAVKTQLTELTTSLGDIDPTTVPAIVEERDALKTQVDSLAKDGKLDEGKVTERINAAVTQAVGPVKRDLDAASRQLDAERNKTKEREQEVANLKTQSRQEKIRMAIRDAATKANVLPTAVDDAVLVGESMFELTDAGTLVTKNDAGVTPGLDPKEWAKDMQERKPHWWPASQGGGARGGTGVNATGKDNPWSPEGWNVTAQGAKVRELGAAKAGEMAAKVGSKLGATKPPARAA